MNQNNVKVGNALIGIFGTGFDKEKFNKILMELAQEENRKMELSEDGYIMYEDENGEAQLAIPTSMLPIIGDEVISNELKVDYEKLLSIFNEAYVEDLDVLEKIEKKKQSQSWKKSNQKHPAFRRR